MDRKKFIKLALAAPLIPLASKAMNLSSLHNLSQNFSNTPKMPVFFFGHGSPMNAIETNEFSLGWQNSVKDLPKPNAIICISAHWETKGTFVTAVPKPKTIHDFGGFPQELFDVQYPANGSPQLAQEIKDIVQMTDVGLDKIWGLDHGSWSVIKHLYPDADVPVLELSIDKTKPISYHYALAKELSVLRTKGVLIIGSGNIVHNLRVIDWRNPNGGYDWALEANQKLKTAIIDNNISSMFDYEKLGSEIQMSIPTPEHFVPMIYSAAFRNKDEDITTFNDKTILGSISMLSFKIG